jgi:hypothetical protein
MPALRHNQRKGVVELTGDDDTGTATGTAGLNSTWTCNGQFCRAVAN